MILERLGDLAETNSQGAYFSVTPTLTVRGNSVAVSAAQVSYKGATVSIAAQTLTFAFAAAGMKRKDVIIARYDATPGYAILTGQEVPESGAAVGPSVPFNRLPVSDLDVSNNTVNETVPEARQIVLYKPDTYFPYGSLIYDTAGTYMRATSGFTSVNPTLVQEYHYNNAAHLNFVARRGMVDFPIGADNTVTSAVFDANGRYDSAYIQVKGNVTLNLTKTNQAILTNPTELVIFANIGSEITINLDATAFAAPYPTVRAGVHAEATYYVYKFMPTSEPTFVNRKFKCVDQNISTTAVIKEPVQPIQYAILKTSRFSYLDTNVFALNADVTEIFLVFANGTETDLFSRTGNNITVTAPLTSGQKVSVHYAYKPGTAPTDTFYYTDSLGNIYTDSLGNIYTHG